MNVLPVVIGHIGPVGQRKANAQKRHDMAVMLWAQDILNVVLKIILIEIQSRTAVAPRQYSPRATNAVIS